MGATLGRSAALGRAEAAAPAAVALHESVPLADGEEVLAPVEDVHAGGLCPIRQCPSPSLGSESEMGRPVVVVVVVVSGGGRQGAGVAGTSVPSSQQSC